MNSSALKQADAGGYSFKGTAYLFSSSSNIFITLVGTLLLVAPLLKWASTDELTNESFFVPFLEIVLGAGLIVFRNRIWVVSVTVLFSIFVIVLGVKTWMGASSCGCLGAYSPPPIAMFAIDLLIVAWGVWLIARCSFRDQPLSSLATYGRIACTCFLIVGAFLTIWWRSFGAMSATIIGRQAFVDLSSYKRVEVGTGEFREKRHIELSNLSPWNSLRLVGYRSSCSCLYLKDFPIVVPPLSSVKLPLYFEGLTPEDEQNSFVRPVRVMLTAADGSTQGLSFTVAVAFQGSN
jgi:uncharacterized membrane protein YidH (DUF202 family)